MSDSKHVVVIGGSAAGVSAVEAMVADPARPAITLISADARLPYKRTKVCKSFADGFERDAFALHERNWYVKNGVELLLGRTVRAIDVDGHYLELDTGARLHWSQLILATGSEARRPALAPGVHVHHAHDIVQVEALRAHALQVDSVLVVGMGVLGTEVSEQLARMDLHTTLVGESKTLMPEHLDQVATAMLEQALVENGVKVIFGDTVCSVEHNPAGYYAVQFANTRPAEFDMVVFCIGSEVRSSLASAAGLTVDRGVLVDRQLRTSHPDVFAAGDVAQHPDGCVTHLWRHAMHQGRVAGLNVLGQAEEYRFEPFRLKCKIFDRYFFSMGWPLSEPLAEVEEAVLRQGERYVRAFYRDGALAGAIMCNDEANQKVYNRAVVEGWSRDRVEEIWRSAPST